MLIFSLPESFISVQLEKAGPRGVIVNGFVTEKENNSALLQRASEVRALKRNLAADFCRE